MNLKCCLLILFFLHGFILSAQIVGLTASKVNSFTANPIAKYYAELEPSYGATITSRSWNENGDLTETFGPDEALTSSGMCIRTAYALSNNLEVACMVPTTVDAANFSAKYLLGGDDKNAYGIMTGLKVPMGNKLFNKKERSIDEALGFGIGAIYSRAFSESFSFDMNLQFYDYLHSTVDDHSSDIYIYADLGKYFSDGKYQVLNGVGYAKQSFDVQSQNVFTWYPGFSIEVNPNLLFVMNFNIDLAGKNAPKTFGFGFAATMTIPKS